MNTIDTKIEGTCRGSTKPNKMITIFLGLFFALALSACEATTTVNTTDGTDNSGTNNNTTTTIPDAPTIGTATTGDSQATVTFTAPSSTGGSAITGYTVTSTPAGGTDTNAGSTNLTHTITGLTNGTSYTFTVHATNAVGNSVESAASNAVTPVAPIPGLVTTTAADWSIGGTNDFNGAASSVVTTQPAGGSQASAVLATSGSGSQYFGTTFLTLVNQEFCTTAQPNVYVEVYAPASGLTVRLKLEEENVPSKNIEMDTVTAAVGWQTLTFNCITDSGTATTPPTAGYVESTVYNVASMFFNFPNVSAGETWYFDTVSYVPTAAVTYVPPVAAADPTVKPAAPTVVAPNFISLYGTTLGNLAGSNSNPGWGQATTMTTITVAGDSIMKLANFDFQGFETDATYTTPVDASGMTSLHIDLYSPTLTAVDVAIISPAAPNLEQAVTVNPTTVGWNSFDIPLTSYTVPDLANIIQLKFVGTPTGNTVYIDNLYFWKAAGGPATVSGAPTIGVAIAGDTQATVSFTAPVSDGGSAITGYTVTSTPAGGTDSNAGSTALSHTITGLTNGTAYTFTVHATNAIGNSVESTASNAVTPAVASGTIVTSTTADWTLGTTDFNGAASSVVTTQPVGGTQANAAMVTSAASSQYFGTSFLTLSGNEFCTTAKPVITVDVYSPVVGNVRLKLEDADPANNNNIEMDAATVVGWQTLSFDCLLSSGFATTPPTSNYVEGSIYNKASIFFGFPSVSAAEVWYFDQVRYDPTPATTYVPPVAAADPTTIPTAPTVVAPNFISVFGTTLGDMTGIDVNPNWGQSTVTTTINVGGETILKYANLNYQGLALFPTTGIDVSGMTSVHVDLYAPTLTAVDVFLVSTVGGEQAVRVNPTTVGWNSFDIPLSSYTGPALTSIKEFKFVGTPAANTVFVDNIYFWK